jgi:hypothetical protein
MADDTAATLSPGENPLPSNQDAAAAKGQEAPPSVQSEQAQSTPATAAKAVSGGGDGGGVATATGSAPPMPQAARIGFILFGALFVVFGVMAWLSNSTTTITSSTPAIVTALLGLVTNPSAATTPATSAGTTPPKISWNETPWKVLIILGSLSTVSAAGAMILGHHPAAQNIFEVVGGGLFGLLIDTSQFSPFQTLLTAAASKLGVNPPAE